MEQIYLADQIRCVMHSIQFTDMRQLRIFFGDFEKESIVTECVSDMLISGELKSKRMYLTGKPFSRENRTDADRYIDMITLTGNEKKWVYYSRSEMLDMYRAFFPVAYYKSDNVKWICSGMRKMKYVISTGKDKLTTFTSVNDIGDVMAGCVQREMFSLEKVCFENIAVIPMSTDVRPLIPILYKSGYAYICLVDENTCKIQYMNVEQEARIYAAEQDNGDIFF